jgi:hypothetical protein
VFSSTETAIDEFAAEPLVEIPQTIGAGRN